MSTTTASTSTPHASAPTPSTTSTTRLSAVPGAMPGAVPSAGACGAAAGGDPATDTPFPGGSTQPGVLRALVRLRRGLDGAFAGRSTYRHRAARAARVRRRRVARLAVVLGVVAGLCVASTPASAQEVGVVLAQAQSVDQVLTNVRNWLMGILAGLATVMATVGGIRYTMADGDPGEVQRAKTAFRSAGIGFALAALAPLLVTILQGLVGL